MTKSPSCRLSAPFPIVVIPYSPPAPLPHPSSISPSSCYFRNLFLASQHVQSELFIRRNWNPARQSNRILFVPFDTIRINKVQTLPCSCCPTPPPAAGLLMRWCHSFKFHLDPIILITFWMSHEFWGQLLWKGVYFISDIATFDSDVSKYQKSSKSARWWLNQPYRSCFPFLGLVPPPL